MAAFLAILSQSLTSSAAHGDDTKEVYLPLGDSYTIGQGVPENERFPNQLILRLKKKNVLIELAGNPARSGWTTRDAERTELSTIKTVKPTLISLLIGVNDQVQGSSSEEFSKNLSRLLDRIEEEMKSVARNPKRVVLISIPDYSRTPSGASYAAGRDSTAEIRRFNTIIAAEAQRRGLAFVDIFHISNAVSTEPALLAADGLHPSGALYSRWSEALEPEVLQLLQREKK